MKKKKSQEDVPHEVNRILQLPSVTDPSSERASLSLPPVYAPPGESAELYKALGDGAHIRVEDKRPKKALWISLACVVGVLLVAYFGLAIFFMSHFSFNTDINGINGAFMTVDQVNNALYDQVDSYRLEIDARNNNVAYIKGSDVDLSYVDDGQVQELLDAQNVFQWPLYLFVPSASAHAHANVELSEDKLNAAISGIPFMDPAQMKAPQDAYLEYVPPSYQVHAEDQGTTLDQQLTHNAIEAAMTSTQSSINLDDAGCYLKPTVLSNSSTLNEWRGLYNKYVAFSITYTFDDGTTEVIDGREAINWITIGETQPGELNYDDVVAWVNDFADRHDTLGKDRTIVNGYGEEKTVQGGGDYGWQIDRDAEVQAIIDDCRNHTAEVREPYYITRGASTSAQDWGTTYIEVDLTDQHMWYFENSQLMMESDVVTGQPDGVHNTPPGVYYILTKESPSILVGELLPATGEPEYRTQVSFWMPFTTLGHGFHDATWQPWFGGNRYTFAGSHGCVNMPYDAAGQLYSLISVGCPVVIHY